MHNPLAAEPLLAVEGLSVMFPTPRGRAHALQGIDIEVPRGGALALVGESGSGKSTVVLALLGLLGRAEVSARRMAFDGADLRTRAAEVRGRRLSVVFQDPSSSLNPALTVGSQVIEPLLVHARLGAAAARGRGIELLGEVGLPRPAALMDAYPHQLSGGMKQRAAIAMALAAEPDMLLLDEPTTALDVTVEAGILDLLMRLRERRGVSLLLVSHNLGIVDRLCDTATVLYAGRVVETGTVAEVLRAPRHPYSRGLLAAVPRRDQAGPLAPIPGGLPDMTAPDPGCNFRPRCPFAATGCEQPQLLIGVPHPARCHRADAVADELWPAPPAVLARPASHGELVRAEGLCKRFGPVQAVNNASLAIAPGEILGVVGESGCGKSTLGRLMLRLLAADAGTLDFDGTAVPDEPPIAFRRRAQIVFQNPDTALNPRQTVGAILTRPLQHFGLARGADAGREVARLLELVRLPASYAARFPHQLSGGEKQRVGIARALASRPDFIICDEAVSALDVSVQAAVLNLLAELRRDLGLTLLFISHDIGVIGHISDRVAVLYGGTVMELGSADAVLSPPFHPYTEALLSAVPVIGGGRSDRIQLPGEQGAVHAGPGCRFALRCHRRVGPICVEQAPPWREIGGNGSGHHVRCHIPAEDLARIEAEQTA